MAITGWRCVRRSHEEKKQLETSEKLLLFFMKEVLPPTGYINKESSSYLQLHHGANHLCKRKRSMNKGTNFQQ
jgi:hypothetical protein